MTHIKLLFRRLGLVLSIFGLCRLIFLLFNWNSFKNFSFLQLSSTFYYGLLFDISALVYFNILFIIGHSIPFFFRNNRYYQGALKILFLITNGVAIFLDCIDFGFFRFSGKRTGSEILKSGGDIKQLAVPYLRDYWHLTLIFIILVCITAYLYPKLKKPQKRVGFIKQFLVFILVFLLSLIGARGGFYLKPIRPFDAVRFVEPGLVPLALNTPFQLLGTIENPKPESVQFMSDKEALKIFNPEQKFNRGIPMNRLNVVIIILESFSKEYVGYYNHGGGYTPFLDSLCGQSLVFMNAYANGRHSIDAIPSILCSMPSLLEMPYIDSYYQGNKIESIGKILHDEGYSTGFYHGAHNGTMGFDNFIHLSQFGPYKGFNEYPGKKDDAGEWGIDDEPYLQYFAGEMDKMPQPFCTSVFTLSSHHPYFIPAKYKGKFEEGTLPIHKSIRYSDFSLKQFFKTASKKPWYKNTLFVITADHTGDNEKPYYHTFTGRFEIPLLFFRGNGSLKGQMDKTVAQIDILPGILQYMGYSKKFKAFGKSPFDSTYSGRAIQYENATYQFIHSNNILHFNGTKPIAFYQSPPDSMLSNNLIANPLPARYSSEKYIKAFLQVFHRYLDENKM